MAMAARFRLRRITAVAGVLRRERLLTHQRGAMHVCSWLRSRVTSVRPCGRRRERGRLAGTVVLVFLLATTVAVTAMAHSAAAAAEGKQRQCADAEGNP